MTDAVDALLKLSLQFLDNGGYAQAAKCLRAVCNSKALPVTLAIARLLLGQLLLDHTHDISQAKENLTAAELILRSNPGNYLLRCETMDTLARCYQQLGALPQQKEAFVSGIRICREGAQSKDRSALLRWIVYFHFKLAEYSLARDSAQDAIRTLQDIAQLQNLTPTEQVLQLLSHAFLHLHINKYEAASDDLKECQLLLDTLSDQQGLAVMQLRVHMLILAASISVAQGRLKDLGIDDVRPDAVLPMLKQLVEKLKGQEWVYGWMPARQVEAVVALLHATAYRSIGKMSTAAAYLAKMEQLVDHELEGHQFELEKTEGALSPHAVWEGRNFALLKLLIVEQYALQALIATDFAKAAQHIAALIGIVQRFPTLMRDFIPTVNVLQGFYAQSLGEYTVGIAHFKSVLDCESCGHLHTLAAASAALCELHRDDGQAGVGRAVEMLECITPPGSSHPMETSNDLSTPHDKAVRQLVSSLIALRQGDSMTAKVQLARTLKMSHNIIGNSQLVGTVLVALAPVQLDKGDISGAAALLDSAFTILKGIHDVPSMIASLNEMAVLLERKNESDKLARNREYTHRKARELQELMEAARATEAHQLVLRWTLMQQ